MKLISELFDYQLEAVEKLSKIKVGALYMEMGTGKTRTALELIQRRLDAGKVKQVLWLCPYSVQSDLYELLLEHAEDFDEQIKIAGIESLSNSIRIAEELMGYVVSKPTYLIVDESLLVKNPFAYRTQRIIDISKECQYKLILNGTPISRNEADLFAQWYILDWRILGYKSYYSFSANHLEMDEDRPGRVVRVLEKEYLAHKIAPYTYECRKEDVLKLPKKQYFSNGFYLTEEQEENYDYVSEILLDQVDEFKPETIYRLFSALQAITSGFSVRFYDNYKHSELMRMYPPNENPRIECLMNLLDHLKNEQVVIYCHYTQEIEDICELLGNSAVPFYGEMTQDARQTNKTFFKSGKAQYFVANKSCAQFGLNLQFCHNEIFYDNDWDWGTRAQAEDRLHRAGQIHDVNIYDIYAKDTLDETIMSCLDKKERLSDRFKDILKEHNKDKLKSFLNGDCRMEKIYNNTDVYTAFQKRLDYIFSEFENIYISFSGGKDSGVLYQLVIKYMLEHGITRNIGLFHEDFEAQYSRTTEFVNRIFSDTPDFVERFWCCLPMGSKTCVSSYDVCWYPWNPDEKDLWVRDMPDYPYVVNLGNNPFDFYKYKMMQDDLYKQFGKWYKNHCGGGKTVALIGIRASESLNRYNSIINKKHCYKDEKYITYNSKNLYTAAPLYDWETDDIWTATGKFELDYNRIYDLFYMAGIPIHKMRVASPFNEWAIASLNYYKILEPDTWNKIVNRVEGASFSALYGDSSAVAYRELTLPEGHTWQTYYQFLLDSLPVETREQYEKMFAEKSDWKQMCRCILKNDHSGRTLVSEKKESQSDKIRQKYSALIKGRSD